MIVEVSANVDTFLRSADFAAMRSSLSLTAFATTVPGTGVIDAIGMPVNSPGGFYTGDPAQKANLSGGAAFNGPITITHSSNPALDVRRTSASTSGIVASSAITAVSSGNVTDGFCPILQFRIEDTGISNSLIGSIGFARAGSDDTGDFVVRPQIAGTAIEKFRVNSAAILSSYTVATVPSAALHERGMIYVSNESGGATVAYSNGTNWKRVYDNANIS